MKKIILEIPVLDYEWIDVPTLYGTFLGDFEDIEHVHLIGDLVKYLQRHEDRQNIIKMDYQLRETLCRELIRNKLYFIQESNVYYTATKLSHFLARFQPQIGYNFDEYKFDYRVLSNGRKIQFKDFTQLFNNEDEALRHIIKIYANKSGIDFKIVEN